MCLCRVKTLKKDINFMIYMNLFYEGIVGEKIFLEMFKCCFVGQMNCSCIAMTKDFILKNEKTIFVDGFFFFIN